MTFGEKLKKARKKAGMTQEELAIRLSVSRQAITKWESGKGLPDIENLKILSKTLDISLDYLLNDETKLDMAIFREEISLDDYPATAHGKIFKKDRQKDMVVRSKYPSAEIHMLYAQQIKTNKENKLQFFFWLSTPFANVIDIINSFKNTDKMFYLVSQENKQFLAVVTEDYIESRQLINRINEKRFAIGSYRFVDQGELKI